MKKDIHPTYYKETVITCSCGNTFTTGSTLDAIQIEVCSSCHPFFTGKQKFVDTARRVEKFEERAKKAVTAQSARGQSKKSKRQTKDSKKAAKVALKEAAQ